MKITQYHKDVINAKVCPYCKSTTKLISEKDVYGRTYKGKSIIACDRFPVCDSFVGTHSDGTTLGRLANKELRAAKIEAHKWFDEIWKKGYLERSDAYLKISKHLKIAKEYTHIGMFSVKTCEKVVEWSKREIIKFCYK